VNTPPHSSSLGAGGNIPGRYAWRIAEQFREVVIGRIEAILMLRRLPRSPHGHHHLNPTISNIRHWLERNDSTVLLPGPDEATLVGFWRT
jgi:hypothetical protein